MLPTWGSTLVLCSALTSNSLHLAVTAVAGMVAETLPPSWLQVFRTEHYSHAIQSSKTNGQLGLIAVIVYTIAIAALAATAIVHPGEIQNTLLHPRESLATMASPQFPWRQIAFTGLLSTDFVIYIEVRSRCIGQHRTHSSSTGLCYACSAELSNA